MALSAAVEYRRGMSRTIRGERRSLLLGSCGTVVLGWVMGSIVGLVAVGSTIGALVGGVLLRVCRACMRGAVCAMSGAVGCDDVGLLMRASPFEGCHGSVVGLYPGVSVGALPVNFLIAAIVVM